MVLFGGGVVSLGRFFFIVEMAEVNGFAMGINSCGPFFVVFVPMNAFILRGGISVRALVSVVLGLCAVAKVLLSIVQAIVIDVVTEKMRGSICEEAMHKDCACFGFIVFWSVLRSVTGAWYFLAVPAEL